MEILQNLSKSQLIQLIKEHPRYKKNISTNQNKSNLIDLILSLDIPISIDYSNLKQYSVKLLKEEAKKYPDYVPTEHGKMKSTLVDFIDTKNKKKKEDQVLVLKDKLLDCLLTEDELDLEEENIKQILEEWL